MIDNVYEAKILSGACGEGFRIIHVAAINIGVATKSIMQYRDQHLKNGVIECIRLLGVLNVSSKDVV